MRYQTEPNQPRNNEIRHICMGKLAAETTRTFPWKPITEFSAVSSLYYWFFTIIVESIRLFRIDRNNYTCLQTKDFFNSLSSKINLLVLLVLDTRIRTTCWLFLLHCLHSKFYNPSWLVKWSTSYLTSFYLTIIRSPFDKQICNQ